MSIKIKNQKTWLTIHFESKLAHIEVTINYKTRSFVLTHGSNDQNVTFTSEGKNAINDMMAAEERAKCVNAALLFIKKELSL
jgi:hypothetical protein